MAVTLQVVALQVDFLLQWIRTIGMFVWQVFLYIEVILKFESIALTRIFFRELERINAIDKTFLRTWPDSTNLY